MAPGPGPSWSGLVLLGWIPVLVRSHEVLEAVSGQNVTLRCLGPVGSPLELLQWVRLDLDLAHDGYVFFYRENRSYQAYQFPAFMDRVFLRDPQIRSGDVSIVLKEVDSDDTGTYECRTSDPESGLREEFYETRAKIRLLVKGFHQVHSDPGQDLVLPCFGPKLDQIQLLQWSRLDLERLGFIYVYDLGNPDQTNQIQDYRDRVHLRDPQLTGGDAALVLKDVRPEDSGNYSCFILFQRINQDRTRAEPGLQRLEETHHLITLTVSGSPENQRRAVIALVFVLVLGLCMAVLVMVWRRTRAGVPYQIYIIVWV